MKMTDILEQDKTVLLQELASAGTADKAVRVLDAELDKLLLTYNEETERDREREAAAYLTQAVRLSLPLMDTNGETNVWERGGGIRQTLRGSFKLSFLLFFIAGIALCGFGLVPVLMQEFVTSESVQDQTWLLLRGGAIIAGMFMIYFAGYRYSKPRRVKEHHEYNVDIRIDTEKVFRNFRAAMLSVDQSLEEIRAEERWKAHNSAGSIDGREVSESELEIFSDLLAASYSGDPEYALEKIDQIKYFLHKQQIEVVDYCDETEKYFDMMPGSIRTTIRPALMAKGELLKKGLASAGK